MGRAHDGAGMGKAGEGSQSSRLRTISRRLELLSLRSEKKFRPLSVAVLERDYEESSLTHVSMSDDRKEVP